MENRFYAYDVAIEIARGLVEPLREIKKGDAELHDQAYRALKSMGLNIAEGGRRVKKDRRYHFDIAAGSAQELKMALDLAVTFGFLRREAIQAVGVLIERELAMLWKLARVGIRGK